jgi:hypothetical protein
MRLKYCRLESSLAISAGEDGEDPSSSSSRPERGICVDSFGGGEGALNLGLDKVGLFRSGDVEMRSDDCLRWYTDADGGDWRLEFDHEALFDGVVVLLCSEGIFCFFMFEMGGW